ncbi:hypothetical protein [Blastopirellula marina]|uniref:Uncharacterized protein n=1 Tax=Blastopirellula marina TaxID=124 RepID=A0A2S8FHB9_9BACT|nr:hypothetical protein [Blastopirellula marina]PQO31569.1 hypothetical protein C5Y98_19310 [Blastopirellula marina]PTL42875.1 hypothetical protein C5Y97_19320 [Blastopirellula marina]
MKILRGQSFPLIFLMLLVAFSAILARIAQPIVQSFQESDVAGSAVELHEWATWSISMVVCGAVVGFIVGWVREKFWPGALLGIFLGAVVGAFCTPFLAVPSALTAIVDLGWLFASLILLVFGTILIERRYGLHVPEAKYVKTLEDDQAKPSHDAAAGEMN